MNGIRWFGRLTIFVAEPLRLRIYTQANQPQPKTKGAPQRGYLLSFHADSSKPLLQRNALRDGLHPILAKLNLKQDGKAFHSFRRFRVMHLRKSRVPWNLEKFWISYANKDVTDKYAAQMKEDVEWRKDVAEKTGQGFALPASSEISIGQLGQPRMIGREAKQHKSN